MAKRDASNLNETNVRSSDTMVPNEAAPFEGTGPSSGQAARPPLKDEGFAPAPGFWDGQDGGKAGGSPVEITERGTAPGGGMSEADDALRAIGARPAASHAQTSLLNVSKGDAGEKTQIPSESHLNSANQRVGA